MVKPISPDDVGAKEIPEFVIDCVNQLIRQEYRSGYACFKLSTLNTLITENKPKGTKFEEWWLDFEPLYEAAGWEVEYDKPGYNETYPATFTFRAKK